MPGAEGRQRVARRIGAVEHRRQGTAGMRRRAAAATIARNQPGPRLPAAPGAESSTTPARPGQGQRGAASASPCTTTAGADPPPPSAGR